MIGNWIYLVIAAIIVATGSLFAIFSCAFIIDKKAFILEERMNLIEENLSQQNFSTNCELEMRIKELEKLYGE